MYDFIKLVALFCVCFTIYFVSMVVLETKHDMKNESGSPRWVYLKKFWRKFVSNMIYHLP